MTIQDERPDAVDLPSASSRHVRLRCDSGQVAGIEVLPFGFLLFVCVTLLFVNVWGVIDAKLAVTSAAREAARAYSESANASEAQRAATTRARETLGAYGRDAQSASIDVVALQPFGRCARSKITVHYQVPAIRLPFIGGLDGPQRVESSFTEVVDPFRNHLAGAAKC